MNIKEKLYGDIHKKIKMLAFILFVVVFWFSVLYTLYSLLLLMIAGEFNLTNFLCILFVGMVYIMLGWIGTLTLYGFGQLIENTTIMSQKMQINSEKIARKQSQHNYWTDQ